MLRVYNEEDQPITVQPELYNFTSTEEVQGTPDFYPANDVRNGHELAPWIKLDAKSFVIQPHELHNLSFAIEAPADAQPGGHFGAIRLKILQYGNQPVDPGSQINLIGTTSSLILVRVTGNVQDNLVIAQFAGDKTAYSSLPVDFHLRVQNTGTSHLRPVGNVFIKNIFGKQVASIEVNGGNPPKSVLPGTARRFDVSWYKHQQEASASEFSKEINNFAFGKYTAELFLSYGPDNRVVSASYDFWVIPWQALLLIAGVLLVAVFLIILFVRGYNGMIIRRYEALKRQGKI